jgi:hypothetical protein
MNSLQSLNTSGVHAARCCAVPCDHAGAAKPGAMIKVAIAIRLLSFIVLSPAAIVARLPTKRQVLNTRGEAPRLL